MKIRKLKVCEATCVSTKNTPCIGLHGHWFEELGYKVGDEEIDEIGPYNRPKLDIEIAWNTPFINIQGSESGYGVAV